MDLINREDVITIATSSCLDLDSYDDTDEFCDEVKELPSAFEGMSNGEVIQALFPEVKVEINGFLVRCVFIEHEFTTLLEWWDAPYKAESEVKPNETDN